MSGCTAPVRGHSSSSAAARCPACRYRYGGGYGYGGGYSSRSYSSHPSVGGGGGYSGGGSGRSSSGSRPRWSRPGSSVVYTDSQVQSLTPVRETIEKRAEAQPDLRDCFLCHAWDDRQGPAKQLFELLKSKGVKVWFSESDVTLGMPLMRTIDKGLANSRIGLVLVTPKLLGRLPMETIADKELSVLLAGNLLVPIVHETTYAELRNVSPMLASRSGLDTAEDSMEVVATKIAELVQVLPKREC